MPVNQTKAAAAIVLLLEALGEDPTREGLRDTPQRVARFWADQLDEPMLTVATFAETSNELVIVRDIAFHSFCEHHLLPFRGVAHIGYIPNGCVLGLSKLVRLLDLKAHRLQVQERLTNEVAQAIEEATRAQAVGVILEAEHLCMTIRGVQRPGAVTVTSSLKGSILDQPHTRAEFLLLIRGGRP